MNTLKEINDYCETHNKSVIIKQCEGMPTVVGFEDNRTGNKFFL